MTYLPRRLVHPGPVAAERIQSFRGEAKHLEFNLEPGLTFRDAVSRPLLAAGFASAGLLCTEFALWPFRFVRPAFSPDDRHVAYYSDIADAPRPTRVAFAGATFGFRDDEPFVHCHALWDDEAGEPRGGHIWPLETVVSESGRVVAFGCGEVAMVGRPDPETNFTLFGPEAVEGRRGAPRGGCIVARVRPNEDLIESLETLCERHGIREATVRSGIGSTVGFAFDDGRTILEIPTEIVVSKGRLSAGPDGRIVADLEIALIDMAGKIHRGKPARGLNPVLICLELVIEVMRD